MPRPDTANTWPCMDGEAGGVSMNRSLSIHSPPMASCWRPLATRRGVSAPASRDRPHHRGCPASRALGSPDRAPLGRGNRMPSPRRASCPAFIPRAGARGRTGTTAAHERRSRTRLRPRAPLRARAGAAENARDTVLVHEAHGGRGGSRPPRKDRGHDVSAAAGEDIRTSRAVVRDTCDHTAAAVLGARGQTPKSWPNVQLTRGLPPS